MTLRHVKTRLLLQESICCLLLLGGEMPLHLNLLSVFTNCFLVKLMPTPSRKFQTIRYLGMMIVIQLYAARCDLT